MLSWCILSLLWSGGILINFLVKKGTLIWHARVKKISKTKNNLKGLGGDEAI